MQLIKRLRKFLAPAKRYYWRSQWRESLLRELDAPSHRRLVSGGCRFILFLVPGVDFVNGGIMSIFSIAKETMEMGDIHGASTTICVAPNETRIRRFTKFANDLQVLAFRDIVELLPPGSDVLVHVPEVHCESYVADAEKTFRARPDVNWSFNLLLQNIDLIPDKAVVERIRGIGRTTATTAHAAYGTDETAKRLGCPVYHLSTWVAPEAFNRIAFHNKDNLIIYSPDDHPEKVAIVRRLAEALPDFAIVEINDMTYRQYRETIERAKFSFTFGEGLDGYFVETVFSGGLAMAMFNNRFFEPQYQALPGIFSGSQAVLDDIGDFVVAANRPDAFQAIWEAQFDMLSKNYVRAEYLENLRSFYRANFAAGTRRS